MSSVSSTDSYFFQLYPHYFKVEHAFAKNMKPNTTYRLVIYKGTPHTNQASRRPTKWQNPLRANWWAGRSCSTTTC
jgi:hypothetical protein